MKKLTESGYTIPVNLKTMASISTKFQNQQIVPAAVARNSKDVTTKNRAAFGPYLIYAIDLETAARPFSISTFLQHYDCQ